MTVTQCRPTKWRFITLTRRAAVESSSALTRSFALSAAGWLITARLVRPSRSHTHSRRTVALALATALARSLSAPLESSGSGWVNGWLTAWNWALWSRSKASSPLQRALFRHSLSISHSLEWVFSNSKSVYGSALRSFDFWNPPRTLRKFPASRTCVWSCGVRFLFLSVLVSLVLLLLLVSSPVRVCVYMWVFRRRKIRRFVQCITIKITRYIYLYVYT